MAASQGMIVFQSAAGIKLGLETLITLQILCLNK